MADTNGWAALGLNSIVSAGAIRTAVALAANDSGSVVDTFIISSLPTHGQLFASVGSDTPLKAGDHVTVANGAATLYFQPEAGFTGTATFGYRAADDTLIAWGDSRMTPALTDAVAAFVPGLTVINAGTPGQWADQILARQGGVPARLTIAGNQIPSSGSVAVTARGADPQSGHDVDILFSAYGYVGTFKGTLGGVPVAYTTDALGNESIIRLTPGDAVTIMPGTEFIPDDGAINRTRLTYFDVGTNGAGIVTPARLVEMLSLSIGTLAPGTPYIIGSIIGSSSAAGADASAGARASDAALKAAFGQNYLDLLTPPTAEEMRTIDYTPTAADLTDIANGYYPIGMYVDTVHFNDAGSALQALRLSRFILSHSMGPVIGAEATATLTVLPGLPAIASVTAGTTLVGTAAADRLVGSAGDDQFFAGDTASTHVGDTLVGGAGNDTYNDVSTLDTIIEQPGAGIDTVTTHANYTLPANIERLVLLEAGDGQAAPMRGTGNALDNVIVGNAAANQLFGLDGADILYGLGGDDILYGGLGADTLTGGDGRDTFAGTRAELAGDTITDFARGETIRVTDVALADLSYARSGTTLRIGDAAMVIGMPNARLVLAAAPGGGTDLVAANRYIGLNDFNGDGHSDILWRNDDGTFTTWNVSGNVAANRFAVNATLTSGVSTDWKLQETLDWNGDGRSDILWRNSISGQFTIWTGGATGFTANAYQAGVSTDWKIVGVGDLNGDGRDDIVWRNDGGMLTTWQANGSGFDINAAVVTSVSSDWRIVGLADFDGDGKDDLLWRNAGSGAFTTWLSNGATPDASGSANNAFTPASVAFVQNAYGNGSVGLDWHIDAMADFNGDGKDDLLWRHDGDGVFTIWQSTGTGFIQNTYGDSSVNPVWQIQQAADYNDDGKADLLWRNSVTGEFSIWQSTGNGFDQNVAFVGGVGTDWHVQAHDYAFG